MVIDEHPLGDLLVYLVQHDVVARAVNAVGPERPWSVRLPLPFACEG